VNFKIVSVTNGKGKMKYTGVRYFTNQEDYRKFDTNLATNFISSFNCINKTEANKLDEELQGKVKQYNTRSNT
jgi:YHS domain-containing protein